MFTGMNRMHFVGLLAAFTMMMALTSGAVVHADNAERIQPYSENPFYWQYQGEPILLIGASDDHNLFQWEANRLAEHLDLLVACGGNYVRNTMSSREEGNIWPFARQGDRYNLDEWNEAFWERLQRFLQLTHERGIIVQIEIWDLHDLHGARWDVAPWNPANNVNYEYADTHLGASYTRPMHEAHDFFLTVPALNDDREVLRYQNRFVEQLLSISLEYKHVLYCIDNEIHPPFPPEWGWYWAELIHRMAEERDVEAHVTEMFWTPELRARDHRAVLERPDLYTYFEASQVSSNQIGWQNWDIAQWLFRYLEDDPRPINHVKIYGGQRIARSVYEKDEDSRARFWRNLIGGSASSRFHRPTFGIGLSESAQSHLRSMRMLAHEYDFFSGSPDSSHRLLSQRRLNEAYANSNTRGQYVVYFPDGGDVILNAPSEEQALRVKWLDIENSAWHSQSTVEGERSITLEAPGEGHWAVLIMPVS